MGMVAQLEAEYGLHIGNIVAQVFKKQIDCSAGGTAQESAVFSVPAKSILLNVMAVIDEVFDGDTTTTFEVGVEGNTDKYIDPSDFEPEGTIGDSLDIQAGTNQDQKGAEWIQTETDVIATWTNTDSASAGKISVYIVYAPFSNG